MLIFVDKDLRFAFSVNFPEFPEHNGKARIRTDIHLIPISYHVPDIMWFNEIKLQTLQVVCS